MADLNNTVTKAQLDDLVAKSSVEYAVFGNKLTVSVITLPSNFKVTGEASCVDASNFDKELGEKYALENAVEKLWELEGYLLAERLYHRAEWLNNQTGDLPVKCTAPQDPEHELTEDEIKRLNETGSLCDCMEVVQYGGDCPIEEGDEFDFGSAIHLLKTGKTVARKGWNGKNMYLIIIQGSNDIAKLHGYGFGEALGEPAFSDAIFLKTADNKLVPWTISQSDALATDWCLA